MGRTARAGLLPLVLMGAVAAGCASARLVVIEPRGGVVAVPGNTPASRAKAGELMAGQCPGGYDITREEEIDVGRELTEETTYEYKRAREEVVGTTEYRTRTRREWRIHFSCR